VSLQFGAKVYFDLSRRLLTAYADRHGYELVIGSGGALPDARAQHWGKLPLILEALERADLVFYVDADVVVVDPSREVASLLPLLGDRDLLAAHDSAWNVNTGVMLVRSSARDLVQYWAELPGAFPELGRTWPLDELAFNRYVLAAPDLANRVAVPVLERGTVGDFIAGSFVQHFCNGDERSKLSRMARAVR
jgi:hypothetical protein